MSISRTLSGSPFSIAAIWAMRKNSSSAWRLGSPVSASVLARSSDLFSESRIASSSRVDSTKRASSFVARVIVLANSLSRFSMSRFGPAVSLSSVASLMASICERLFGDGHRQILIGGGDDRMELVRNVVEIGVVGDGLRSDIGRKQVVIGGGVELSFVADQNIDRPFEIG